MATLAACEVAACSIAADLSYRGPARDGGEPCAPGAVRGGEICDVGGRWRRRCADGRLGREEICNLVDDDCDGLVDESLLYEVLAPPAGSATSLRGVSTVSSPRLVRTDNRIALVVSEGVSANNCSDVIRTTYFDADGLWQAEARPRRGVAAAFIWVFRPLGDDVLLTFATRENELTRCSPPINDGTCPLFTLRLRESGDPTAVRSDEGNCGANGAASRDATLLLYPRGIPDGGAARYDIVAVGEDGRIARRAEGALATDGTAIRGVAFGDRVHWFWGAGRTLAHRTTAPDGSDLQSLPDLALTATVGGVIEAIVVGGSLFVRAEREGRTHFVEVAADGSVRAQATLDVGSGEGLTPSLDGRQLFSCSLRTGVSFARFARDGAMTQRRVAIAADPPAGDCVMMPTTSGVLVAWSLHKDGTTRWARIGCRSLP